MSGKYNGWTNYENVEPCSYNYWRERARDAYADAVADKTFSRHERAALDLADMLKDETEEQTPVITGFYADVLNAAIGEVNWYEIARHWIDEQAEDSDTEQSAEANE